MILSEQAMILALRQMILASRRAGRQGLPLDELVDLVQQPLPEATRCSVYRLLKLLKRNGVRRLPKQEEQAPEAGGTRNRPRRQTRPVQGLWAWDYGPGTMGLGLWAWDYGPGTMGLASSIWTAMDCF